MDNRINFQRPTGPILQRKLGDRSSKREQTFVLPRNESADEDEPEVESEGEPNGEPSSDDSGLLSPQPRRDAPAVSRVRLEDEAGQRIDLRG